MAGIDSEKKKNVQLPPQEPLKIEAVVMIGRKRGKEPNFIKTEELTDEDHSIDYVHLNKPNNLVIVDADWLFDNLQQNLKNIRDWKDRKASTKNDGSWFQDCWVP